MKLRNAFKPLLPIIIFYSLSFSQEENTSLDSLLETPTISPDTSDTVGVAKELDRRHQKAKLKRKRKREKISGWISVENIYDDNILDYSKTDLDLLKNNSQSPKFLINKADDVIASFESKLKFRSNFFRKKPTELSLNLDLNFYTTNSVHNYQIYEIAIRQKLFSRNYLTVEQSFIPKYYLRHLWNQETFTYRMAKFKRRWTNLEWEVQNLSNFDLAIGYIFQFTNYNQDFDERDTKAYFWRLRANYQISTRLSSRITYTYVKRNAKGKDNPDPSVADISNQSNLIGVEFEIKKLLINDLSYNPFFNFEWQKYSTDRVLDKYHYKRKDKYFQHVSSFSYRVSKRVIWYLAYSYETNETNVVSSSDPTSYTTHKVKGKVEYLF